MKEKLLVILIASVSLLLVSCLTMETPYYSLFFCNNSENELYILYRKDIKYKEQYVRENEMHEDSTLYNQKRFETNWSLPILGFDDNPEDFLKPTDTLTVFILDKEEYEGKNWSQLVDSVHFRQIYHLSGDDIRLLKSDIPYPPTEKMRNMDMVPSYDEIER